MFLLHFFDFFLLNGTVRISGFMIHSSGDEFQPLLRHFCFVALLGPPVSSLNCEPSVRLNRCLHSVFIRLKLMEQIFVNKWWPGSAYSEEINLALVYFH